MAAIVVALTQSSSCFPIVDVIYTHGFYLNKTFCVLRSLPEIRGSGGTSFALSVVVAESWVLVRAALTTALNFELIMVIVVNEWFMQLHVSSILQNFL